VINLSTSRSDRKRVFVKLIYNLLLEVKFNTFTYQEVKHLASSSLIGRLVQFNHVKNINGTHSRDHSGNAKVYPILKFNESVLAYMETHLPNRIDYENLLMKLNE
jgi:hypothetical protein